jgi:hypothetical protein
MLGRVFERFIEKAPVAVDALSRTNHGQTGHPGIDVLERGQVDESSPEISVRREKARSLGW